MNLKLISHILNKRKLSHIFQTSKFITGTRTYYHQIMYLTVEKVEMKNYWKFKTISSIQSYTNGIHLKQKIVTWRLKLAPLIDTNFQALIAKLSLTFYQYKMSCLLLINTCYKILCSDMSKNDSFVITDNTYDIHQIED